MKTIWTIFLLLSFIPAFSQPDTARYALFMDSVVVEGFFVRSSMAREIARTETNTQIPVGGKIAHRFTPFTADSLQFPGALDRILNFNGGETYYVYYEDWDISLGIQEQPMMQHMESFDTVRSFLNHAQGIEYAKNTMINLVYGKVLFYRYRFGKRPMGYLEGYMSGDTLRYTKFITVYYPVRLLETKPLGFSKEKGIYIIQE